MKDTIKRTLCAGENFVFRGKVFDKLRLTDTIVVRTTTQNTCDSIITVQIAYLNAPIIKADNFTLAGNKAIIELNVFENDVLDQKDKATVSIIQNPTQGILLYKGNGIFQYT